MAVSTKLTLLFIALLFAAVALTILLASTFIGQDSVNRALNGGDRNVDVCFNVSTDLLAAQGVTIMRSVQSAFDVKLVGFMNDWVQQAKAYAAHTELWLSRLQALKFNPATNKTAIYAFREYFLDLEVIWHNTPPITGITYHPTINLMDSNTSSVGSWNLWPSHISDIAEPFAGQLNYCAPDGWYIGLIRNGTRHLWCYTPIVSGNPTEALYTNGTWTQNLPLFDKSLQSLRNDDCARKYPAIVGGGRGSNLFPGYGAQTVMCNQTTQQFVGIVGDSGIVNELQDFTTQIAAQSGYPSTILALLDRKTGYILATSNGRTSIFNNVTKANDPVYMNSTNSSALIALGKWLDAQSPGNYTTYPGFVEAVNVTLAGTQWFLELHRVSIFGVDWEEIVMVNYDDIMGKIVASAEAAQHEVAMIRADTQKSINKGRSINIAVAVAGLILGFLAILLLAFSLTRSIDLLCGSMYDVAEMRLEDSLGMADSPFSEVRSMQESFHKMVEMLREYRAFLPQYVLANEADPAEEVHSNKPAAMREKDSQHSGSQSVARSRRGSSRDSKGSSSHQSSQLHKKGAQGGGGFGIGLSERRVTAMVIHLRETGGRNSLSVSEHDALFEKFWTTVNNICCKGNARGTSELTFGLGIIVTFNASNSVASAKAVACDAAIRIKEALKAVLQHHGLRLSIGISSSKALAGVVGTSDMRKFNVVGQCVEEAKGLEQLTGHYSSTILVSNSLIDEVRHTFSIIIVDRVGGGSVLPKVQNLIVFEPTASKDMDADEWMYQLQTSNKVDPYVTLNDAWFRFLTGQSVSPLEKVSLPSPVGEMSFQRLQRLVAHHVSGSTYTSVLGFKESVSDTLVSSME